MKNIEFIESNHDIDYYDAYSTEIDYVSNSSESDINVKNVFIKFLITGACAWSFSSNAKSLDSRLPFTNSIENTATDQFVDDVDLNLDRYLYELEKIVDNRNYNKHELITKIISFRSLEQNWDGFNSIPLEVESTANAIKLIDLIGEDIICSVDEVYPNPNGTISLLWSNRFGEELSLEIGNNSMSYYFKSALDEPQFFNNIKVNSEEASKLSKFIQIL